MIPIYDDNPALGKPILVVGIIVLCVIIWFWQSGLGYQANNQMIISYGLTPGIPWKDGTSWPTYINFYFIYIYVYAWRVYAFSRKYALSLDI